MREGGRGRRRGREGREERVCVTKCRLIKINTLILTSFSKKFLLAGSSCIAEVMTVKIN